MEDVSCEQARLWLAAGTVVVRTLYPQWAYVVIPSCHGELMFPCDRLAQFARETERRGRGRREREGEKKGEREREVFPAGFLRGVPSLQGRIGHSWLEIVIEQILLLEIMNHDTNRIRQSSTRETEPVGWIYGWMDGWIEIYCKELAYTILEPGQASLRAGHQGGQAGAKRPSVGRASSLGLRNDRTRPTQMLLGNFSYLKTTGYTF